MNSTLNSAESFNQPLSGWNVSKVTTMGSLFQDAKLFNQNIGNWNVSGVTTLFSTFYGATSFNNNNSPSISGWTTSKVTS
jgi:surface protein